MAVERTAVVVVVEGVHRDGLGVRVVDGVVVVCLVVVIGVVFLVVVGGQREDRVGDVLEPVSSESAGFS